MFAKEECYLTIAAIRVVSYLIGLGIDQDLALDITLKLLGEESTFISKDYWEVA